MDAVGSLMRGVLPPAGNPICVGAGHRDPVEALFPEETMHWVDSGTSALALALQLVRKRRPEVQTPEVIIPAYCCPDLVSAALFAGFTPVLVDMAPDSCHYDQAQLEASLVDSTLAIIAVNFLGLAPPLEAMGKLCEEGDIALIEDSAQWFPDTQVPLESKANYRVFSFGRGKAVSLLGGGLLVGPELESVTIPAPKDSLLREKLYHSKCLAYNWLLRPKFYQFLDCNPLIKLGETRYHPLESIESMAPWIKRLVPANLRAYQNHKRAVEQAFRQALEPVNQLTPLLYASPNKLLRYPLLVSDIPTRHALLRELKSLGLGATGLYDQPLTQVFGVPTQNLKVVGSRRACDFSERLITLPVHQGVNQYYQTEIIKRVLRYLG